MKAILVEAKTSPTLLFGDKLKEEMKVLSEKSISLAVDGAMDRHRLSRSFLPRRGVRNTDALRTPGTRATKGPSTAVSTRNVRITKKDQGKRTVTEKRMNVSRGNISLKNTEQKFTAGKTAKYVNEWRRIISDIWVLKTICR